MESIKHNARLVVEQMVQVSGFTFGYNAASVSWLDGYINRIRVEIDQATTDRLISVFGSYLGECVINCYGGYWEEEEGQWRVSFDERNGVYPFAKVRKQFENGAEDSIKSFFKIIPIVFGINTGEDHS
jgi:hypothetical protein